MPSLRVRAHPCQDQPVRGPGGPTPAHLRRHAALPVWPPRAADPRAGAAMGQGYLPAVRHACRQRRSARFWSNFYQLVKSWQAGQIPRWTGRSSPTAPDQLARFDQSISALGEPASSAGPALPAPGRLAGPGVLTGPAARERARPHTHTRTRAPTRPGPVGWRAGRPANLPAGQRGGGCVGGVA